MNINTLSETDEITIFQDADTGNIYIYILWNKCWEPRNL